MIREATIADLPKMEKAATAFYQSSQFLHQFDINKFVSIWTDFIRLNIGVIFLCETDRIVGAIGGLVHENIYSDQVTAEEFFWFIEPEFRGEGIQLYECFYDWSNQRNASEIQMLHLADSMPKKLAAFYLSRGYRPIETRYSLLLKKQ